MVKERQHSLLLETEAEKIHGSPRNPTPLRVVEYSGIRTRCVFVGVQLWKPNLLFIPGGIGDGGAATVLAIQSVNFWNSLATKHPALTTPFFI